MNENLHYHQFKLFYGAQELKDTINESYDRAYVNESGHGEDSAVSDSSGYYGDFETESLDEMWSRKLRESKESPSTGIHGSGVHESIMKEGIRPNTKVSLEWGESDDGPANPEVRIPDAHHRVAAAADIERTTGRAMWIPVNNEDYGLQRRLNAVPIKDDRANARRRNAEKILKGQHAS